MLMHMSLTIIKYNNNNNNTIINNNKATYQHLACHIPAGCCHNWAIGSVPEVYPLKCTRPFFEQALIISNR